MLDTGTGRFALLAAILMTTAGLAGCATPGGDSGPIVIGTLLPQTGTLSTFGPDMQRAVELAAEEINDAGGVDGRQIEIVNEDSRTDPSQAPQAMQRLINEGVVAVVGAASSGVTGSVIETAVSNDVVLITPASTSPALTNRDNNDLFFRVPPNDVLQGKVMAQVLDGDGIETVSTLYVNNDYGEGLSNQLKATFENEYDGSVLRQVSFDNEATSFDSEIQQAAQDDPDAIVYVGYPGNGVPLMRQAHDQGIPEEIPFYFSEGVFSQSFIDDVGQTQGGEYIMAGFKGTTPEALTGATTEQTFSELFNETYDHEPGLFAAQAYDATAAVALAIAHAGSDDADDFKQSMRTIWNEPGASVSRSDWNGALEAAASGDVDYAGVSTDFNWNEDGDPVRGLYAVWQVTQEGQIELVQRGIEETIS